jgi:membrane protein required for colicin V production
MLFDTINLIDVVIFFLLATAVIDGMSRGLVSQALQLGTMLLVIYITGRAYQPVVAFTSHYIIDLNMATVAGFITTFILATIIISTLRDAVLRSLEMPALGPIDRLVGGAFGLANGAVFATLVLLLVLAYPVWGLEGPIRSSSVAAGLLQRTGGLVLELLPGDFPATGVPGVPLGPGRVIWHDDRSPM